MLREDLFYEVGLDYIVLVTFSCSGILRVGQEIEVRPGIVTKSNDGKVQCTPIYSKIVSLFAEQVHLQYAVPGGKF